MPRKDFLSILDLGPAGLERCLELGGRLKADRPLGAQAPTAQVLAGRYIAMLFEKSSLRTRTTFEVGVRELGGEAIGLQPDIALGQREPVADIARSLERWVDGVVVRTFSQRLLGEFAASAHRLHVINALTDDEHPCQILADCLALRERWGTLRGRTIAFVGDGNNVATSLAYAAAMLGMHLHIASPEGYRLPPHVLDQAVQSAGHGARLRLFDRPAEAVAGVDAVYTDTWTSMGKEAEAAVRRRVFAAYQVNDMLMALAKPGALFMHCLPAHCGEEVTTEVFESPVSIVFDQAENRLHAQKALLVMLLAPQAALSAGKVRWV
ncbi:MAG: ornithine carbamoyltransferase [Acidobacteriota bacterium]